METAADALVIGGGLVGSAIGFGMAKRGARVIVLDEGDRAFRAATGNAGLVWYQGKGRGMRRYQEWTLEAIRAWPGFADSLKDLTGIDVTYQQPGGLAFCISDAEYEARRDLIDTIRREAAPDKYDCMMLDRKMVQELLPGIKLGESVTGASYSPQDGHVNPLALLKALHAGLKIFHGFYYSGHSVVGIRKHSSRYEVRTGTHTFTAPKLLIAAGNGTGQLARMVGMTIPVRPEKGEILVTERSRPCLPLPCNRIRQSAEGSFLIGASQEDAGFDIRTNTRVIKSMANRARNVLPVLGNLRIIRSWAALRVKTPDKMPVYEKAESSPDVFAIALHSGVTLASQHAVELPKWVLEGHEPAGFHHFSSRRFDVQKTGSPN